jgi:hypothetical protein
MPTGEQIGGNNFVAISMTNFAANLFYYLLSSEIFMQTGEQRGGNNLAILRQILSKSFLLFISKKDFHADWRAEWRE